MPLLENLGTGLFNFFLALGWRLLLLSRLLFILSDISLDEAPLYCFKSSRVHKRGEVKPGFTFDWLGFFSGGGHLTLWRSFLVIFSSGRNELLDENGAASNLRVVDLVLKFKEALSLEVQDVDMAGLGLFSLGSLHGLANKSNVSLPRGILSNSEELLLFGKLAPLLLGGCILFLSLNVLILDSLLLFRSELFGLFLSFLRRGCLLAYVHVTLLVRHLLWHEASSGDFSVENLDLILEGLLSGVILQRLQNVKNLRLCLPTQRGFRKCLAPQPKA